MARSLFAAARLAASISENAAAVSRRSFAAVSVSKTDENVAAAAGNKKAKPVEGFVDSPDSSWVPDPVTGYYRPGNRAAQVDPAELRQRLLSNNRPAARYYGRDF